MKFSIPFNGQADLLKRLDKEKITEIYGKLSQDFLGGGRASCINPYVSREKISSCVREAKKYGINFNYLLNASCLGNREWIRSGQKKIRSLLDWLDRIGVDTVSVSSPYLAELIKKNYAFRMTISSMTQIHSIAQAKAWEDLGADEIALSQIDLNRNFPAIREIRKNVKCGIKLVANEDCFFHCPNYFYHANVSAHASQNTLGNYFLDYCRIACRLKRISEPVNFIRASWIRPEDVPYYEEAGVDVLKIIDRGMTTEAILRIAGAYAKNRYDGNLLDLLPHPSANLAVSRSDLLSKIRYFFRPFYVNVFKLYRVKSIMNDFDVYIENRALDGFIEFFLKENCESRSCRICGYCHEAAKKAVKINSGSAHKAKGLHQDFLNGLISGNIFKYR
ncbi:MAG: U32 family peptidase [Candidatus Omnitrophica bacterium]|nr:U32 family peptidase [Candidatus Omnitrophota bacterium]